MVIPGALAIFSPLIIGFLLGPAGLIGMLAGAIASGFMLAVSMANAGGAWDNAKKFIEAGSMFVGLRWRKLIAMSPLSSIALSHRQSVALYCRQPSLLPSRSTPRSLHSTDSRATSAFAGFLPLLHDYCIHRRSLRILS
jgi:hypothetical protein